MARKECGKGQARAKIPRPELLARALFLTLKGELPFPAAGALAPKVDDHVTLPCWKEAKRASTFNAHHSHLNTD